MEEPRYARRKAPVVNVREEKADIFVGRPSRWGNPFKIGLDGTREEVIAKYADRLDQMIEAGEITAEDLRELGGKTLGCFCAPLPCHADVLSERAAEVPPPSYW